MNEIIKDVNGRYYPRRNGEYFYKRIDALMKDTAYSFDVFWRINFDTREEAQRYIDSVPESVSQQS